MRFLLFHSKAALLKDKDNVYGLPRDSGRTLSNFGNIPVEYEGDTYPTVEHAFQAMKYKLASTRPELYRMFVRGGELGPDPVKAKMMGGRKGMKTHHAELDVQKWSALSEKVMEDLVREKMKNEVVRAILIICLQNDILLLHHSRGDMKWGCHANPDGTIKKGENLLGQIYMKTAKKLQQQSQRG